MKPFDYNAYLKNNPLLKENLGDSPITDSYFVRVAYNDYPSIGDQTEARAMMSFTNLVNKLGGMANLAQNKEQYFGYKCFEVSGVDYNTLSMAWKKTHANNRWIIKKEEQKVGVGTPTRQMTGDADADFMGEGFANEAETSELKLSGPDVDELLDAIKFLNNGIGKGNQKVKLPFGNNTLKALENDGKKDGGKFSIKVKATKSGNDYIKGVNAFLDDHGFDCRLKNSAKLNEFDAVSFFQGQAIQQAMQSAPQAMSEADKIITYVLMTVGIGAVAGGLAAIAKDKLGSLNPIPAIKQWWADRQKRKALEPIVAKLKKDPEVMKYVANKNMKGIQTVIKSKLSPEEQKYIGSLTRDALSELRLNESTKTTQTLKSTKPGDKLTLVLDDDSTVTVVRVGNNKSGEPTFKHIKNNKEVGTASALSASHIKSVK